MSVVAPDKRSRHIYGVFLGGRCIYVGQTSEPAKREKQHIYRFRKLLNSTISLKVLAIAVPDISDRIEECEIRYRKSQGEAEYNKCLKVTTCKVQPCGTEIYCVETREIFESKAQLAAALGYASTQSITNMFVRFGAQYAGYHFLKIGDLNDKDYQALWNQPTTGRCLEDELRTLKKRVDSWQNEN